MENIKQWFENDYETYDIEEYDGCLEAKTKLVRFLIISPQDVNKKWTLRISTLTAFDRWANSTGVERFFDTEIEVCLYLHDYQLDIYKDLLEYLSLEYEDLEETTKASFY